MQQTRYKPTYYTSLLKIKLHIYDSANLVQKLLNLQVQKLGMGHRSCTHDFTTSYTITVYHGPSLYDLSAGSTVSLYWLNLASCVIVWAIRCSYTVTLGNKVSAIFHSVR